MSSNAHKNENAGPVRRGFAVYGLGSLEVDGKDVDSVDNVRTTLGDSTVINFDLKANKQKQQSLAQAAETGTLTKEQTREMSAEQKAQLEKAAKEREQSLAKNKALNDAFNQGMQALAAKQYDAAIESFTKAGAMDPKQNVVWAQLAESYTQAALLKAGPDRDALMAKGLEAYTKALEIKPDDAAYHNNYALALAKAKKFPESQAELAKAAQLDPPNAGRYFFNLGAVLVNTGQNDAACEAFKKAIDTDANYADAQYQFGMCLTPAPGTKEALEKYLQLKPAGPFADSAKGALASLDASISTKYENPAAATKKKKK